MAKPRKKKRQVSGRKIETALPKRQYKRTNRLLYIFSGILLVVFGGGAALLSTGTPPPPPSTAVVATSVPIPVVGQATPTVQPQGTATPTPAIPSPAPTKAP